MQYNIRFCPQCAEPSLAFDGKNQYHCPSCGFTFYRNVAAAAAAIIYQGDKILFIVRGKEPGKGMLGLPGGFIDSRETAEEGLRREVREEVGLELEEIEYFCNQTNRYHYRGVTYDTLDFYYIAHTDGKVNIADEREVQQARLIALEELDFSQLAFSSTFEALERLKNFKREQAQNR